MVDVALIDDIRFGRAAIVVEGRSPEFFHNVEPRGRSYVGTDGKYLNVGCHAPAGMQDSTPSFNDSRGFATMDLADLRRGFGG